MLLVQHLDLVGIGKILRDDRLFGIRHLRGLVPRLLQSLGQHAVVVCGLSHGGLNGQQCSQHREDCSTDHGISFREVSGSLRADPDIPARTRLHTSPYRHPFRL